MERREDGRNDGKTGKIIGQIIAKHDRRAEEVLYMGQQKKYNYGRGW